MGFLDKAKKVAEQAKELADQAKDLAEERLNEARAQKQAPSRGGAPEDRDSRFGTAYVPGMLGRPGWREQGLVDPAALLPIDERDRAGIARSTKSEVLEEPFGMGRRWSSGGRSAGVYYQLYPEHRSWQPPGGTQPAADLGGTKATTPDGKSLVFVERGSTPVVLELSGLGSNEEQQLARALTAQLAG